MKNSGETNQFEHDNQGSRQTTSRRGFVGQCSAGLAMASAAGRLLAKSPARRFPAVTLTSEAGRPLKCSDLDPNREYIFHYPFKSTPCFLINLDKPLAGGQTLDRQDGSTYTWLGGVGPQQSVVAFSAICAHKLSHPSPAVSFIGYREQAVGFYNQKTKLVEQRSSVIQCCSEHSLYDPAAGARVLSGPAPQPLAAIELHEQDGRLTAVGVYGGALFERYFEQFGNRLMIQHKGESYADAVESESVVLPGDIYTSNRIECS